MNRTRPFACALWAAAVLAAGCAPYAGHHAHHHGAGAQAPAAQAGMPGQHGMPGMTGGQGGMGGMGGGMMGGQGGMPGGMMGNTSSHQMQHGMMMGMRQMGGMALSGDLDKDFVRMMRMHHLHGIEMARMELARGKNEEARRFAQRIIDEQQKEVQQLDDWLRRNP